VADRFRERLDLVKRCGYETIDTTSTTPIPDQIEAILGAREVDAGVDCVGLEAHGYGKEDRDEHSEAIINVLFNVVRAGGAMGIPGIYTDMDPGAPKTTMAKRGELPLAFSKAWIKSPKLTAGQSPGHALQPRSDDGDPVPSGVMWCLTCPAANALSVGNDRD
jgi:glutathione-independent formaldehyde dehydrogenase